MLSAFWFFVSTLCSLRSRTDRISIFPITAIYSHFSRYISYIHTIEIGIGIVYIIV